MLALLYPYEYVESAFAIDYERLYENGYRALIFDIDNTLVPHGADATAQTDALLQQLQARGFQTFILSNNGVARIERFIQNVPMPYLDNAKKPLPFSYRKALKALGVNRKQAVFIGDQVFTDILGANLSGMASILVKYIGYYEAGAKGKRRDTEAKILARYQASTRYTHRLGNVEKEGQNSYGC
ncbi:MAG: YqeG family HAD IIIA-type phosphatase [Clostridia bacterium]|nr:YqeG family HAD IIIA-type phosphatase [Clostridia bacterium]